MYKIKLKSDQDQGGRDLKGVGIGKSKEIYGAGSMRDDLRRRMESGLGIDIRGKESQRGRLIRTKCNGTTI